MSVQNQVPIVTYTANGQTVNFPITFDLHDDRYLVVTVNKEIPPVGSYVVTQHKAVVFNVPPSQGAEITLARDTVPDRTTNFKSYDNSMRPEVFNYDFDKIWHFLQEQNIIDAITLARIKEEIEWRRTHDFNYDELARARDKQVFDGLKGYIDTYIAGSNPNIFGGVTAGVVFALDHKSVQTHLEDIADQLEQNRKNIAAVQQGYVASFKTYALADAAKTSLPKDSMIEVTNDPVNERNGRYVWDGVGLTKSSYDPVAISSRMTSEVINNPFLSFTTSISVDSNGIITFPSFSANKYGDELKNHPSIFEYSPASNSIIYYIYYRYSTNEIVSGTSVRKADGNIVLIGMAYQGRFASQYAVKYKTDTNAITKLSNEVINSKLNPNLPYDFIYQFNNQSNADFSPVVTVSDDVLKSLGVEFAQKIDASLNNRGAFAQVNLFERKLRGPLRCSFAFLVHDPLGKFDFGTGGPIIYCQKLNANGGGVANFLTIASSTFSFTQLSDKTRLYYRNYNNISLSQSTYPDSYMSNFIIGLRASAEVINPLYVSGYWFSYTDDVKGFRQPISLSDTHYPYFDRVSSATVLEHYYNAHKSTSKTVIELQESVKNIEKSSTVNLVKSNLNYALNNPLHSVYIRLIGDSITWGVGAENSAPAGDRNHSLNDQRNNLTCKSWANLLRDYLGQTYANNGFVIQDAPGSGYYEKEFIVDVTDQAYFQYIERSSDKAIAPIFNTDSISFFNKTLRLSSTSNSNGRLKFKFVGSKFRLMYTAQQKTTDNFIDVYANNKLVASFDYSAANGSQKYTDYVELEHGIYDVVVMNRSVDGGVLRLEAVCSVKKVKVSNDGISGTGSWEWIPGTALYKGSIQDSDEFVFVMLGTNDKGDTTRPPNNEVKTYNFVKQIVVDLKKRNKNVIVMAANAVTANESDKTYTQADTSVQLKKLSVEQSVLFVDQYAKTLPFKLTGDTFLADGLHPNDLGYRVMFENIKNNILDL
ncbi:SGNH/GDSL hydrolase family protein [Acinetobacter larvae]|uniref:SGNH hydrolase-type esterase domain-containing protein n=1 Tax=Acinetobacter larvae TaxID=1789224 RepID=A0A1B2LXB4_9GAMM|nr:SGNH/GDSL hydrolase family protein [Acinetobacter larvae]AOA57581.1 hypothetical protein BFG52_03905 [Acinetobacter larvae]